MKKVIVIGAGVSGLSAAARLQFAGYQVTLLEKEAASGGRMQQVSGDGFSFDLGPTMVVMPALYREAFEACNKNPDDYILMERVEPMLTLQFQNHDPLVFSGDIVELTRTLEHIGGRDTQGYFSHLAGAYGRYLVAKNHFLSRSFRGPWDFLHPKAIYHGLRLRTLGRAYASIPRFVKDDRLKKALAFHTLYTGAAKLDIPPLYAVLPMIQLLYGVWFIKGGMRTMAEGLKRLFLELGGKLQLNKNVEEILIRQGRACGVRANGMTIPADYVVCSADFPYAVRNLIARPENRGSYTDKLLSKLEYSCSGFVLYLGLNKKYPVQSLHTFRFAGDFSGNVADLFDRRQLPWNPSFSLYVPSILDASLAPEGCEALYVFVPVPGLSGRTISWDEAAVQTYRDQIIQLLEKETPFSDISEHIVFERRFTPEDFENRFNAMHGAVFGLNPTSRQSDYFRPHNKFGGCEKLYFCGGSTHPGAGVPLALTSARLAAEELMRDDRRGEAASRPKIAGTLPFRRKEGP